MRENPIPRCCEVDCEVCPICYDLPLFAAIHHYSHYSYYSLFATISLFAIRVFQTPLPLSVNAFKAHELEIYSNVASLPRRADSDVSLLFRKIDINRSAVDISTCLHLSE